MDRIWKYFTVLVLIEMIFLIALYATIFKNSTTLSNVEIIEVNKRGQDFVNENNTAFTFPPHSKLDRNKNTEINHYKSKRLVSSVTADVMMNSKQEFKTKSPPFSDIIKKMRTGGEKNNSTFVKLAKSKKWSIRTKAKLRLYNTSYISTKSGKSCIFSFDNESLHNAREQLSSPYYLFNVHLKIDGLHGISKENQDRLLHWQYVLKKENFLIQLPVDVDLLTYTLLEIDKEETTISIKLLHNDSDCFQNNFPEATRSVQLLLWNKLFLNDTDYYLCNRHYESADFLNALYYITTIWVGYDLTCSEVFTRNGLHVIQELEMKKGFTPVVTSIFCYILSLQFVWIFVLLDVRKFSKPNETRTKTERNSPVSNDETYVKSIVGESSSEMSETYQPNKHIMKKGGHPVSISIEETSEKCIQGENSPENSATIQPNEEIIKSEHETGGQNPNRHQVKIECCPKFSESKIDFYTKNDRPYGLKRFIFKILYGKCSCACCCCRCYCKNCCIHNPTMRLLFLMWVFILLPFGFYRTFGRYEVFRNTYEYSLTVARPSEPLFHLINHSVLEGWIVTLDVIYATVLPFVYIFVGHATYEVFLSNDMRLCYCVSEDEDRLLITNNERIDNRFTFRYFQFCRSLGKLCFHKDSLMESNGCKCTCKCKEFFQCVFSCLYCVFPCIPFSCFTHKYIADCACCRDENENENDTPRDIKGCKRSCFPFVINVLCLFIVISYIICLRPIFSTFTFLLRSFTYIVFVVFPNRTYIMRVTIMIVTAVFYFSNYIHEIINMNAEILNYLFKLEEQKQSEILNNRQINTEHKQESRVKRISEEDFVGVYEKLMFVKKGFYILYLKMIIVIMYLFITFTTFIMNTKSLTGPDFKDILQFLLILIGPYAIIFFLKANNSDFLTEENKKHILEAYETYSREKQDLENPSSERNSTQSSLSFASITNDTSPLLNQQRRQKTCHSKIQLSSFANS